MVQIDEIDDDDPTELTTEELRKEVGVCTLWSGV
jgi:hypothetical protein